MTSGALLSVSDLSVTFPTEDGDVHAVRGVSFDVAAGETVGIVGESGSGKSVCTQAILQLVRGARVGGTVRFDDRDLLSLRAPGNAQDSRRTHRHGVPGSALEPAPAVHRRLADRRGHPRPRDGRPTAGQASGYRPARGGRHPGSGSPGRRLPAPVLRRDASAGHAGDGVGPAPRAADRRRADDRARRHRAGPAPRPARPPPARARHGDRARDPRSRRGRPGGRPGADDVRRSDRGGGDDG